MVRSWDECVDLGYGRGRAERSTAEAVRRIDADLGRPADVNEAWRSPEQANANRARWLAYERYLNGGPWAPWAPYALGAEDSVHCDGEAIDSDDWYNPAAAAVWRRHGFRQTARYPGTSRDEIWHGEHRDEWEEPGARPAGGNATPIEEDDMYSTGDRERDEVAAKKVGQAHQALWNNTSEGAEWPGVLERLDRLEADHRALEHVMDGSEVPADVSARQGGKREPYTRKLGRWIKSLTA